MTTIESLIRQCLGQSQGRIEVLDNQIRSVLAGLPRGRDNYVQVEVLKGTYKRQFGQTLPGAIAETLGISPSPGIARAYFIANRAFDFREVQGQHYVRAQQRKFVVSRTPRVPSVAGITSTSEPKIPKWFLDAMTSDKRVQTLLRRLGYIDAPEGKTRLLTDLGDPTTSLWIGLCDLGYQP